MATTTSTSLLSAHSTSVNNGSSNNTSTIASNSDESLSASSRAARILVEYESLPQFSSSEPTTNYNQHNHHNQSHQQHRSLPADLDQRSWSSSSQQHVLYKQSSSATLSVDDALSLNSLLKRQSNTHHTYHRSIMSSEQQLNNNETQENPSHQNNNTSATTAHLQHPRMDSGGGPHRTPPVRPTRTAEEDYYPTAAAILASPPTPTTKHTRAAPTQTVASKKTTKKGGDSYYPSPLDFPADLDLNWTDGLLETNSSSAANQHGDGDQHHRGYRAASKQEEEEGDAPTSRDLLLYQEASPTRSPNHPSSARRPTRNSHPYASQTAAMDPPPRASRPPRRIPKGGLSDPRIMMDWQNNNNNIHNNHHHNHHAAARLMVEETSTVASEAQYAPQEVLIQDDYTAVSTISGTAATIEADHLHALLDEVLNVQDSSNSKDLAPRLPRGEEEHNVAMPPDEYANIRRRRPERWTPMERTIETHHRYREPRNYRHGSNNQMHSGSNIDIPPYGPSPSSPLQRPRESQSARPAQPNTNLSAPSPLAPLSYHQTAPPTRQAVASSPPTPPQRSHRPLQIEVAQGQYESVRGAQETMTAVNAGTAEVVSCPTCEGAVAVVADCKYVMCPTCRIMFPMPLLDETVATRYGVGLGLDLRL